MTVVIYNDVFNPLKILKPNLKIVAIVAISPLTVCVWCVRFSNTNVLVFNWRVKDKKFYIQKDLILYLHFSYNKWKSNNNIMQPVKVCVLPLCCYS